MNQPRVRVLGLLLCLGIATALGAPPNGPVDKVNVLIGTTGPAGVVNYGGVCPWVAPPHAMTDWTPMTQENEISRLPYRNEQRTIIGFMGTHQPTVWMGDYGFVTLMPESGARQVRPIDRGLAILPGSETAKPYYYGVTLRAEGESLLRAEMTATPRCALLRFTYPRSEPAHLLVEMSRVPKCDGWVKISADRREIVGYDSGRHNEYRGRPMGPELKQFKGYFVIQFERPFAAAGTWLQPPASDAATPAPAPEIRDDRAEIEGVRVGAVVTFGPEKTAPVRVRIGSSFISLDQARENLAREIPSWDFDAVAAQTRQAWNDALERVEVTGGSNDEQTVFYTALYHSLLFPRRFDEYGKYYSAFDEKIHPGVAYNDYSMWDTFRALHPLLTLIDPEEVSPMIRSLLQMYDEGGWMPKWPNPTYTNIMIGTPADAIVADAFVKGFRDYDVEKAYAALYKDAMTPPDGDEHKRWAGRAAWTSYEARAGLTYYKQLGYVPVDKTEQSVSCTLEYAFEDYCVAQVARGLGKAADAQFFIARAQSYRHVFNPATGFMQPRQSDGAFFDTGRRTHEGFTEGTPWTYLFCVMHDVPGLIELMGRDAFIAKLDENFSGGHYAYDNEPENHYPYLYDWVDQPEKTARILTDVVGKSFRNTPDGITGNDDCGQMSAWYIFAALGFYPVAPASGAYAIGRPFFPQVVLHLTFPTPRTLTIVANHLSPENIYVQSVRIDGRPLPGPFVRHADLVAANVLEFDMARQPPTAGH